MWYNVIMTAKKPFMLEVPDELIFPLIDAINLLAVASEGNRHAFESYFAEDPSADGYTHVNIAHALERACADKLRDEAHARAKRDPDVQDTMHKFKMWTKYGGPENTPPEAL